MSSYVTVIGAGANQKLPAGTKLVVQLHTIGVSDWLGQGIARMVMASRGLVETALRVTHDIHVSLDAVRYISSADPHLELSMTLLVDPAPIVIAMAVAAVVGAIATLAVVRIVVTVIQPGASIGAGIGGFAWTLVIAALGTYLVLRR